MNNVRSIARPQVLSHIVVELHVRTVLVLEHLGTVIFYSNCWTLSKLEVHARSEPIVLIWCTRLYHLLYLDWARSGYFGN